MVDVEVVKQRVADEVERRAEVLVDASHEIHAHPELCYEERFACDLLASGVTMSEVQQLLGHTSTATTSRIYARHDVEHP